MPTKKNILINKEYLKELMANSGTSLNDLAELSGIKRGTVSGMISKADVSPKLYDTIISLYGSTEGFDIARFNTYNRTQYQFVRTRDSEELHTVNYEYLARRLKLFGMTTKELSRSIGKSASFIDDCIMHDEKLPEWIISKISWGIPMFRRDLFVKEEEGVIEDRDEIRKAADKIFSEQEEKEGPPEGSYAEYCEKNDIPREDRWSEESYRAFKGLPPIEHKEVRLPWDADETNWIKFRHMVTDLFYSGADKVAVIDIMNAIRLLQLGREGDIEWNVQS